MAVQATIRIRPYQPADRSQVMVLAPRLTGAGMERRGIATQLMTTAEHWATDCGLPFLTLETGAANQPARRFYSALGYREEDICPTKALATPGRPHHIIAWRPVRCDS
jgi:GNAT superfamily N-acetyltransferase